MLRKRAQHIQKEKDKGIIEMAAEQFARLFLKQGLYKKDLWKNKPRFPLCSQHNHYNVNGKSNDLS